MKPIGFMQTQFKEKFGVPRQVGMVREAKGILKLDANPEFTIALRHLEEFSHIWVIYLFHQHLEKAWRPTIEPPRIGGPKRVGVFASRSPHRPNPVGISAVKLERIDWDAADGVEIHISGHDIMDGTPVIDIKPYLPFADCIPEATSGWAAGDIPQYAVHFSDDASRAIAEYGEHNPRLRELLSEMLKWDPRPTSQRRAMPIEGFGTVWTEKRHFGFRVLDFDVQWEVRDGAIYVLRLIKV